MVCGKRSTKRQIKMSEKLPDPFEELRQRGLTGNDADMANFARVDEIARRRVEHLKKLEAAQNRLLTRQVIVYARRNGFTGPDSAIIEWCKGRKLDLVIAKGRDEVKLVRIDDKDIGAMMLQFYRDPDTNKIAGMMWVWLEVDQVKRLIDTPFKG